ncbi:hypothetical protein FQA47_008460 [Oryzias melastigma]|uniref:Uncharacterized protein n=1 Tax=Oryzias melastigma TaxID=30732 RepID=A0A834CNC4_ORYME|nr:hypothetical protein FQA47_008460 [Oryzias melastigma]
MPSQRQKTRRSLSRINDPCCLNYKETKQPCHIKAAARICRNRHAAVQRCSRCSGAAVQQVQRCSGAAGAAVQRCSGAAVQQVKALRRRAAS